MSVKSCEKIEKSQVVLTVEVGAPEFEAAIEKAYQKMRKKINVPGFRPGKAPRKIIEGMYGAEVFFEEAINIAFPEAYEAAVKEQELQVVPVMWEDNLEGSLLLFAWAPEGTHRVEGVLTDTRYDEPVQVFFEGEEKMGSLFLCRGERPTEEEWLGFFFDLNSPQDLSYQQRTLRYQIEVRAYDQGGNLLAESSYGV